MYICIHLNLNIDRYLHHKRVENRQVGLIIGKANCIGSQVVWKFAKNSDQDKNSKKIYKPNDFTPTISSSVVPFSFYLQFSTASRSFPMSQLFTSAGQNIGASASASVLPMNIQGWFPLGFTCLISLEFKRLSSVFSSTTVGKCQFFSTQPSFWSNSHIHN